MSTDKTNDPTVGTHALEIHTGRVGEILGTEGETVRLRPLDGRGGPWEVPLDDTRPATMAERLAAGVKAANRRSREVLR